jgi:hypothetical protein
MYGGRSATIRSVTSSPAPTRWPAPTGPMTTCERAVRVGQARTALYRASPGALLHTAAANQWLARDLGPFFAVR